MVKYIICVVVVIISLCTSVAFALENTESTNGTLSNNVAGDIQDISVGSKQSASTSLETASSGNNTATVSNTDEKDVLKFTESLVDKPTQTKNTQKEQGKLNGTIPDNPAQSDTSSGSIMTKPSESPFSASLLNGEKREVAQPTSDTNPTTTPQQSNGTFSVPNLSEEQIQTGSVTTKLANGLTVVIKKDDRFPLVSLRLYVHAGSSYESQKERGISHVLEHMVFKGTAKYPKGSIAGEVESAGGYLNAATSFDHTVYLTDMTSDSWKKGLEVLKEMAFYPTLDNGELTSEKDVIVAELKRGEDSAGSRLFKMMQQMIFRGTPYSHPIIGTEETIRSFTSEQIRHYIDAHYQPQAMTLLIVGDIDIQQALKESAMLFGDVQNTQPLVEDTFRIKPPLRPKMFLSDIQSGPWKKVNIALAFPAPDQSDIRSARLDLLSQLLGGDATSYFYHKYKYENRLVDSISVGNYGLEHAGIFFVQATLDHDKLVPFWKMFVEDLKNIGKITFTQKEIDRATLNIEDSLYRSKETLSGLASKMGHFQFFFGGENAEKNYISIIKSSDKTTLAQDAKDIFSPSNAVLVGLLPEGTPSDAYNIPAGSAHVRDWMINEFTQVLHPSGESKDISLSKSVVSQPEVIDLGKGRTVILTPDNTLPYISAVLSFTGGNSLSTPQEQGLATFTASLLEKGTQSLNAKAFEEYQSDRASSFGASAGKQSFSLSIDTPTQYFSDMFTLMISTITSPGMKKSEASRVVENQLAAITATEESPIGFTFRKLYGFLFPGHPYGYQQLGDASGVKTFTEKKAVAFWKKQSSQSWVFSITGDFDKNQVLALVKKLPIPTEKAQKISSPHFGSKKELDLSLQGRQQAHVMLVFPTVAIGSADEPALDLLQNILAGQSGLLFRDLRDKQGLGYTVTAFPLKMQKAGALIFYIGTEPDKVDQAKAGFVKIISELQTSLLPNEELERGKKQMSGSYFRERQRLSARSGEAATLFMLGLPLDSEKTKIEQTKALAPQDIQAVAKKYLDVSKAYTVQVLPK